MYINENPSYCGSIVALIEEISNRALDEAEALVTPDDVTEYAFVNLMVDEGEYEETLDHVIYYDYISRDDAIELAEVFAPSLVAEIEEAARPGYVKVTGHRSVAD